MARRVLMVVAASDAAQPTPGPRRDFTVVADLLGATIIDKKSIDRSVSARLVRRVAGWRAAQAWLAYRRRGEADVIFTDGEHVGIPLALLLRLSRSRVRHVTIGHRLSSPKKRVLMRSLRAYRRIDRIAVHSRYQLEHARRVLGIPDERLALVPYQVDTEFWTPREAPEERLIVSAGVEHRDYPTLLQAVRDLDARVEIGAASHYSRHAFSAATTPGNVTVGAYDYLSLRELYARAAIVVVPLADVDNQAGVTAILEAMSMGKPVVVTQSLGQTDIVEDRRDRKRGEPRPRPVSLVRMLAREQGVSLEPTGFYVPPGDPGALRRALAYLLDHPEERRSLGAAGRRVAEQLFTVENFASRIRELIDAVTNQPGTAALRHLELGPTDAQ
jgi:glycosyltransferase involved in cell wall biosynthesis